MPKGPQGQKHNFLLALNVVLLSGLGAACGMRLPVRLLPAAVIVLALLAAIYPTLNYLQERRRAKGS
jgi:hypothetical protein